MTRVTKKTIVLFLLMSVVLSVGARAADGARKIKTQVQPIMPEIARHMNLKGSVRLEVEVAADGTVKSTKALGGHPVLIQCAEDAVRKWRFEPGPASKTIIEFNFHQD